MPFASRADGQERAEHNDAVARPRHRSREATGGNHVLCTVLHRDADLFEPRLQVANAGRPRPRESGEDPGIDVTPQLGRNGREAAQIGPLWASDSHVALLLLHDALVPLSGEAVYVDLLDHQRALLPALQAMGFGLQRPFTRMVHGIEAAPGDPARIVLAAGPELG